MPVVHAGLRLILAALACTAALSSAYAQEPQQRRSVIERYDSAQAFEDGVFAHYDLTERVADYDTCYDYNTGAQTWIALYHPKRLGPGSFDEFVTASNWNEFSAEVGRLALQGWYVDDMDAAGHTPSSVATHVAILNPAEGGQVLINESDWARFENSRATRNAEGLRLVDIDVALVRGTQRFYGVMRPGTQEERVVRENTWDAFDQRRQLLSGQGWRLKDFGVSATGVVGVFNRGAGPHSFMRFANWHDFQERTVQFDGTMVLTDIECWLEGTNTRYAGVWSAPPRQRRPRPIDNATPAGRPTIRETGPGQ